MATKKKTNPTKTTPKVKQADYLPKLRKTQLELLELFARFCEEHGLMYYLSSGTLLGAVRHKGYIPWDDDVDVDMPRADYDKFIKLWKDTEHIKLDCYATNKDFWRPFAKIRDERTIYAEDVQDENYRGMRGIWIDIFPLDNTNEQDSRQLRHREWGTVFYGDLIIRKSSVGINWNNGPKDKIKNILAKIMPRKLLCWLQVSAMTKCKNDDSKYITTFTGGYGLERQTHLREKYNPPVKLEFEGRKFNAPKDYNYTLSIIYGPDYMQLPPVEKRITHHPIYAKFYDGTIIDFRDQDRES